MYDTAWFWILVLALATVSSVGCLLIAYVALAGA